MKKNLRPILAAGLAAFLAASGSLHAQGPTPALFGITFFGNQLVTVDPATGSATVVGSIGQTVNGYGIAARNGRLFTFDPNINKIREISRVSGRVLRDINIGVTGLLGEGDLAFRPDDGVGFLTSALDGASPPLTPTNDFYTFNIDTGTSVRLGTTGVSIDALAFDSSGTLYAIGQGDATLYTINQSNGVATEVGSLGIFQGSPIGAMAFGPNDILYASVDDRLYRINKSTGAATPVSQTVLDFDVSSVSGLTFAPGAATLGNMSSRAAVGTGDNVTIQGFIVQGTPVKTVLLRGLGPSLRSVSGMLADPVLELFNAQRQSIVRNDNWRDSAQAAAIQATGLAPTDDRESAILQTLAPGAYTAILSGANGGAGVGLAEIFDLEVGSGSRLANLSTRGLVQTNDGVLIAGVIVSGSALQRVAVRAIGPDLTNSGVRNALQDPTLTIRDANGQSVASNDNFRSGGQTAELAQINLTPGDDRDSAIIIDLLPGAYTAIVQGNNGTGIALVEMYNLSTNNQ
ncbi:MAG: hypothetical protein ABJB09_05635 [Verrucomicrobiota bacterium]